MATAQAPLSYIRKHAAIGSENFLNEWKKLPDKDKEDMKDYAVKEMTTLGIEIK